ncbi:Hypp6078 [Branchiostoma lanceolatum]|uniref:Hypp6078 protein n=1 Tax=Branchiostoma lanceolatum TaxID=7740 RepID=A0A8J9VM72_BRALA|nr:Hypp6078 [Branchiostoma lanceolatum]
MIANLSAVEERERKRLEDTDTTTENEDDFMETGMDDNEDYEDVGHSGSYGTSNTFQHIHLDNGEIMQAIVTETEKDFQANFGRHTRKRDRFQKLIEEGQQTEEEAGQQTSEEEEADEETETLLEGDEPIDGVVSDAESPDERQEEGTNGKKAKQRQEHRIYTFDFECAIGDDGLHQPLCARDTIGIIPANGYRHYELQSKEAIDWLNFVAYRDHIQIQHAKNGGEKRVCGRKVDGFCAQTNTVYEYHGCFYHGCKKCYEPWVTNPVNSLKMGQLYADTLRKRGIIKGAGYTYVEIWSHDFEKLKEQDVAYPPYKTLALQSATVPGERDGEASGWPLSVRTASEEDRPAAEERYLTDYAENEGIMLNRDQVAINPGMRALAKLMLNSFWGKFGQRNNFVQTEFVSSPARYFELLGSSKYEVQDVNVVNDHLVEVKYRHRREFISDPPHTNVYLAIFTTAFARLKLYKSLSQLGEAVLYYDTDSIIYKSNGENMLPLGNYLGQFTNECENDGGYITAFCSGGPKNYSYTTASGKTVTKVRGFSLNFRNQQLINFDVMKNMVLGNGPETVDIVDEHKITRDKQAKTIVSKRQVKRYRLVYDKRAIMPDLTTLPFGY